MTMKLRSRVSRRSVLVVAVIIGLLWCAPVVAVVVMTSEPLQECGQAANVIVVARVVAIEGEVDRQQFARAEVQQVWRGSPGPQIRFCAARCGVGCNYAYAKTDELLLLCLGSRPDLDYMEIIRHGSARFEVTESGGSPFIVLPGPPRLPIPQVPVVVSDGVTVIGFALAEVKKYVLSFDQRSLSRQE